MAFKLTTGRGLMALVVGVAIFGVAYTLQGVVSAPPATLEPHPYLDDSSEPYGTATNVNATFVDVTNYGVGYQDTTTTPFVDPSIQGDERTLLLNVMTGLPKSVTENFVMIDAVGNIHVNKPVLLDNVQTIDADSDGLYEVEPGVKVAMPEADDLPAPNPYDVGVPPDTAGSGIGGGLGDGGGAKRSPRHVAKKAGRAAARTFQSGGSTGPYSRVTAHDWFFGSYTSAILPPDTDCSDITSVPTSGKSDAAFVYMGGLGAGTGWPASDPRSRTIGIGWDFGLMYSHTRHRWDWFLKLSHLNRMYLWKNGAAPCNIRPGSTATWQITVTRNNEISFRAGVTGQPADCPFASWYMTFDPAAGWTVRGDNQHFKRMTSIAMPQNQDNYNHNTFIRNVWWIGHQLATWLGAGPGATVRTYGWTANTVMSYEIEPRQWSTKWQYQAVSRLYVSPAQQADSVDCLSRVHWPGH